MLHIEHARKTILLHRQVNHPCGRVDSLEQVEYSSVGSLYVQSPDSSYASGSWGRLWDRDLVNYILTVSCVKFIEIHQVSPIGFGIIQHYGIDTRIRIHSLTDGLSGRYDPSKDCWFTQGKGNQHEEKTVGNRSNALGSWEKEPACGNLEKS